MTRAIADDIAALADAVARLSPNWIDPQRFYEQRSEVAASLRRSASLQNPRCSARVGIIRRVPLSPKTPKAGARAIPLLRWPAPHESLQERLDYK
jgi:hypothetical protein